MLHDCSLKPTREKWTSRIQARYLQGYIKCNLFSALKWAAITSKNVFLPILIFCVFICWISLVVYSFYLTGQSADVSKSLRAYWRCFQIIKVIMKTRKKRENGVIIFHAVVEMTGNILKETKYFFADIWS